MKKLLLLSALLIFACSSDDSDNTNYDCNQENDFTISCSSIPYASLVYGTQEWTVENTCHTTYRDGTPIPEVTDNEEWNSLTTGAWCYYDNDPTKGKLYNWYAVRGIHDNDPNTPYKEFAPEGWHVPSISEWITFEQYLIDNGYNSAPVTPVNYPNNGNTVYNFLGQSLASSSGWCYNYPDLVLDTDILYNQSVNNSSGFNAFPCGWNFGFSKGWNESAHFWTSSSLYDSPNNETKGRFSDLRIRDSRLWFSFANLYIGMSVRLVKN